MYTSFLTKNFTMSDQAEGIILLALNNSMYITFCLGNAVLFNFLFRPL